MGRPAVFFDRDGVLTEPVVVGGQERPPWTIDELRIVPGAQPALDALGRAGQALVVVTNQPDIGRGDARAADVAAINDAVAAVLGLDAVYTCPHDGREGCDCRKPRSGMIERAGRELDLDLDRSWLVGDRWVDIAAAAAVGVRSILIERPASWSPSSAGSPPPSLRPFAVVPDVLAAARLILAADPTCPPG